MDTATPKIAPIGQGGRFRLVQPWNAQPHELPEGLSMVRSPQITDHTLAVPVVHAEAERDAAPKASHKKKAPAA